MKADRGINQGMKGVRAVGKGEKNVCVSARACVCVCMIEKCYNKTYYMVT